MTAKLRFSVWFSVIVVAAFAVGYLVWAKSNSAWPYDQSFIPYPESRQGAGSAGTKLYTDANYGFSFRYPDNAALQQPTFTFFSGGAVAQLAQLALSTQPYEGTNLAEALFTVNAAKTSADKCLSDFSEPPVGAGGDATVAGKPFKSVNISGAAAGNLYESRVYRGEAGNTCFEIVETIHTGNIGNYPAGTVKEVDRSEVLGRLQQVLDSFKFTK